MKSVKNKTVNPTVTTFKILGALFGIGLILALLVPIAMPIYKRYQAEQRAKREAPFLALIPQYTAPFPRALYSNSPTSPGRKELTTPKLHGKILVVNLAMRAVDDLFHELPSERRASVPEEVGVVVWMNCYTLDTVHYSGPLTASQEQCEVTMIDWPARLIRYRMELAGETPPDTVQVDKWGMPDDRAWDEYEPRADRQVILEWILARVE
jgi:hypothetical protein